MKLQFYYKYCRILLLGFSELVLLISLRFVSDIYLYDTQSSPSRKSDYFSFVLQDDQAHVLQKRQITNNKGAPPAPATDVQPPPALPLAGATNNTQTNVTNRMKLDDVNTEVHVLKPNVTILTAKNLGVNGTGIRKNITRDGIPHSVTLSKNGTILQVAPAPTNVTVTSNPVTNSSNQTESADNNDDRSFD